VEGSKVLAIPWTNLIVKNLVMILVMIQEGGWG